MLTNSLSSMTMTPQHTTCHKERSLTSTSVQHHRLSWGSHEETAAMEAHKFIMHFFIQTCLSNASCPEICINACPKSSAHVTGLLISPHWLPILQQMNYKILILMFKVHVSLISDRFLHHQSSSGLFLVLFLLFY